MLPNNFASFMKKMVTSESSGLAGSLSSGLAGAGGLSGGGLMASSGGMTEGLSSGASFRPEYGFGGSGGGDAGTALSKLRSTLTTGLQGTVTKLSPTRGATTVTSPPQEPPAPTIASMGMSQEDRSLLQKVWDKSEKFEPGECKVKAPPIATPTAPTVSGMSPLSPNRRKDKDKQVARPTRSPSTNCRVCVKKLSDGEFFKRCSECNLKVCEDCASYSSGQSDGEQSTWHCSICKRRLSSRARPPDPPPKSTTVTLLPTKPTVLAPVLPTPGKPSALTLMSGFASVASSFAAAQPPPPQPAPPPPTVVLPSPDRDSMLLPPNASSLMERRPSRIAMLLEMAAAAESGDTDQQELLAAQQQQHYQLMQQQQHKLLQSTQLQQQTYQQQLQKQQEQKQLEQQKQYELQQQQLRQQQELARQQSLEKQRQEQLQLQAQQQKHEELQQQKVQQKQQELQLQQKQQQQQRQQKLQLQHQQQIPQIQTQQTQQIPEQQKQYQLQHQSKTDSKDDVFEPKRVQQTSDNNNELPPQRKSSQESDENAFNSKEMKRSTSQLSCESSDESRNEPGRRGRRKSIVRQKSYEEEVETQGDSSLLTLWGTGGPLPLRRHSAQGPARREEALEAARKGRDSLDVPTRTQRHHSCDYDLPNHNLLMASPGGGSSWQSSESDVSSGGPSETGSVTGLEDGRRYSRSSRHGSYRGSIARITTADTGYMALDSSPSPLSPEGPLLHVAPAEVGPAPPKSPGHLSSKPGRADSGSKQILGGDSGQPPRSPRRKEGSSSLSLEEGNFLQPEEDEWRSSRRRSFTATDICRVLPTPPHSPRVAYSMGVTGGSGGSRGTASLESNASRDLSVDDSANRRQSSVNDGETIKIVIHDVETDQSRIMKSQDPSRRRVTVRRDMNDITNRSRGLGMRVVGGKPGDDGRLVAYVVWIVPTGPAENAGVCQGDKVLEWNGVSLLDRSFEEVCNIIEQTTTLEVIDMLLETSDTMGADYREDGAQHRNSLDGWSSLDSEDKPSQGSSRRKLPRLPNDVTRGSVSGKIQVQLWFSSDNHSLVATVLSAHDLKPREGIAYAPPQAFVCLRLFPYGDFQMQSSSVSEPTFKPLWNNSFVWENISPDTLVGLTLELSVWDSVNDAESIFLGESLIDLRHAYLDDRPSWYRLQERRSRSANTTPRGSIVGQDFPSQPLRRPSVRSGNDEIVINNDSRHSSLDSGLLHPDLAWRDSRSCSRRGSSLSEQVECEVYQLTRQFPHSLPQSRRSSFACTQPNSPDIKVEELEDRLRLLPRPEDRRRARSVKVASQSELLYEAGWRDPNHAPSWMGSSSPTGGSSYSFRTNLNRSHSLRGDQKVFQGGSGSGGYRQDEDLRNARRDSVLGPCQVLPRGYRENLADDSTFGEILLELCLTKLHLEVIIGSAKGLPLAESGKQPDTYVKTYLKAGENKLHKRKSRVVRGSQSPRYHQTLRYHSTDALGRRLLLMVWENCHFSHNRCVGTAEINLALLDFDKPVTGYYKLFRKTSGGRDDSDSGESMN